MNTVTAITGRAVAKVSASSMVNAIVPKNVEEVFRLGELIQQSGLAPSGMKSAQAVTVVLLKGLEIGIPPMAALESFGVINGKACIYGDGIPALLWAHGFDIDESVAGRDDEIVATCTVTRPNGKKVTRTFTAQDAKDASLWGKSGPWAQYKPRMCAMRARSWAARDGAADVLKGIKVFEEESDISEPRDITPKTDARLALPDIPDAPEEAPADIPEIESDAIADVDGFLAKLREDRELCSSEDELRELAEGNEEIIARLPADAQETAREILRIDE